MKKIVLEKGIDTFKRMLPLTIEKGHAGEIFGAGLSCDRFKLCTSREQSKRSVCHTYSGQCSDQLGCGVYRFVSEGIEIPMP